MSYPRSLDEYTEGELLDELSLREHRHRKGICDYCSRPPDTSPCKFPERHNRSPLPISHPFIERAIEAGKKVDG